MSRSWEGIPGARIAALFGRGRLDERHPHLPSFQGSRIEAIGAVDLSAFAVGCCSPPTWSACCRSRFAVASVMLTLAIAAGA